MAQVYLGLGSNTQPQTHIANALDALHVQFTELVLSPVYESKAVGFDGDNFLNLVVHVQTDLSVGELLTNLRTIENNNGRDRSAPRFSGRTLDIDILTYDDLQGVIDGVQLPRDEIFKNAFVLKPFSELAPCLKVAGADNSLAQLWADYVAHNPNHSAQQLWPVDFNWQPNL